MCFIHTTWPQKGSNGAEPSKQNIRITWVANQIVIRLGRTKTGNDMEIKFAEKWWTVWLQPMGGKVKESKCMIKTCTILTPDQRVCKNFSLQLFLESGIWNILKNTRGTLYPMLCRNQCKEKPSSPTQQRLCALTQQISGPSTPLITTERF